MGNPTAQSLMRLQASIPRRLGGSRHALSVSHPCHISRKIFCSNKIKLINKNSQKNMSG